jgi:hypothetical protein
MEADRSADMEFTVIFPLKLWFAKTRWEKNKSRGGILKYWRKPF